MNVPVAFRARRCPAHEGRVLLVRRGRHLVLLGLRDHDANCKGLMLSLLGHGHDSIHRTGGKGGGTEVGWNAPCLLAQLFESSRRFTPRDNVCSNSAIRGRLGAGHPLPWHVWLNLAGNMVIQTKCEGLGEIGFWLHCSMLSLWHAVIGSAGA